VISVGMLFIDARVNMEARTLNCPMCGAATASQASKCAHCGARLATVACPSCFGMMFLGARFCPSCGAEANRKALPETPARLCPRCRTVMSPIVVGDTPLQECSRCEGLWVDKAAFERICTTQETHGAALGRASAAKGLRPDAARDIRYVPCPECGKLMNRVNFANCSGVIIDACKNHGTWFDRDELARIVEFIRSGGLELARERRKEELAQEERRLQRMRAAMSHSARESDLDLRRPAIRATSDLLRAFFK
jgi:Zn-finger nucleic acid-binding protein